MVERFKSVSGDAVEFGEESSLKDVRRHRQDHCEKIKKKNPITKIRELQAINACPVTTWIYKVAKV